MQVTGHGFARHPQLAVARLAVDARAKLAQVMVDQVYSFGELGMQEVETSKFLTGVLEENGFTVTRGYAGMPTAADAQLARQRAPHRGAVPAFAPGVRESLIRHRE